MNSDSGEPDSVSLPSPIRRAASMTRVFVGPGMLGIMFLIGFVGSFRPLDGANDAFEAATPGAWRLCVSAGANAQASEQTFLVVPQSFAEKVLFTASLPKVDDSGVAIRKTPPGAFYSWIGVASIAILLSAFFSVPVLVKLFRPNTALERDLTIPFEDEDDDAQL
jgi:hypothetical protein